MTRKLDQIIRLPIASAPFLASICRDFLALKSGLQEEDCEKNVVRSNVKRHLHLRQFCDEQGGQTRFYPKAEGRVSDEKS
ncbi:hypothetical protein [Rhizobium rhizophilum]|uniref:Uncharacterized protein n=1 Tax=Rhizobium rhizophilum TaxID=1850373 RepID=A0ABY2QRB8_9HYPH|nr:hypothetical protein [Rhizobium rhizophilum]THV12407.1 hypothetical protein E9677_16645 [Rhizobium rhizophilum]